MNLKEISATRALPVYVDNVEFDTRVRAWLAGNDLSIEDFADSHTLSDDSVNQERHGFADEDIEDDSLRYNGAPGYAAESGDALPHMQDNTSNSHLTETHQDGGGLEQDQRVGVVVVQAQEAVRNPMLAPYRAEEGSDGESDIYQELAGGPDSRSPVGNDNAGEEVYYEEGVHDLVQAQTV